MNELAAGLRLLASGKPWSRSSVAWRIDPVPRMRRKWPRAEMRGGNSVTVSSVREKTPAGPFTCRACRIQGFRTS